MITKKWQSLERSNLTSFGGLDAERLLIEEFEENPKMYDNHSTNVSSLEEYTY
jgi:hypothetical protein